VGAFLNKLTCYGIFREQVKLFCTHAWTNVASCCGSINVQIRRWQYLWVNNFVLLQVEVVWVVKPCSVVNLWNVGILPQHYTALQSKKISTRNFTAAKTSNLAALCWLLFMNKQIYEYYGHILDRNHLIWSHSSPKDPG